MRTAFWVLIAVAAILLGFIYLKTLPPPNGMYDAFAKCVAHTSTTFYGAFWCPHCAEQKNEFGDAARYLPYEECSLPNASGETPACIAAGIKEYPTWAFPGGVRAAGVQALQTISEKTGCALPSSSSRGQWFRIFP